MIPSSEIYSDEDLVRQGQFSNLSNSQIGLIHEINGSFKINDVFCPRTIEAIFESN